MFFSRRLGFWHAVTRRFPGIEREIETVVARVGFHSLGDYLAAAAGAQAIRDR
jgi:hypothetical protein